jgi:MFS family permease
VVRGLGFSIGATGFVVAVPFIAGSAAMILCGRSAAKRGERILHASLPWLFAAGAYFAASLVHDNWIVLVALVFGAMGLYGAFGSFMSLPSSFLAGSEAAAGIGLFNTLGSLGGFFGPSLVGILRQSSGDYATGLAAISVGFAFAGLIVLALGRVLVPRHVPQAVPAE